MARGPRILDGSPRRPCRTVLAVRVPDETANALDARAAEEGVTAGTIVRRTLVAAFDGDPRDVQPTPRYRAPRPGPSLEVIRLAELREMLGEANGTLRQVAGLDRAHGGARLDEINHALDGLLSAIATVDGWKAAALDDR